MRTFIALDSGGTKTETVLFREDGRILVREVTPGADALTMGDAVSQERVAEALSRVLERASEPVDTVFAGIAGTPYYPSYEATLREMLRGKPFRLLKVGGDGVPMISTCLTNDEDGACLICGTGCGLWIRHHALEKPLRLGGWGYLIDTLGSGYILGRDAFRAVCFAHEGRGEKTVLTDLILNGEFGGSSLMDATLALYRGGRPRIAALAHTVFEGKRLGDPVCESILERGAEGLASLLRIGDPYFDEPYTVVLGGGIFGAYPEYVERVCSKAPPRASFVLCKSAPVFGDAVEALHAAGLPCTDSFRKTFETDYRNIVKEAPPGPKRQEKQSE